MLSYAAHYLQGKNSPHYERNKVEHNDILVVVNGKKLYLTGKKEKFHMYRKPSTYPGNLKEWNAKAYLEKDPKLMIIHSLKGMLPKNKMREQYLKNIVVYDGPAHDIKGLPQFGKLKAVNYNKMFGTEITTGTILPNADTSESLKNEFLNQGLKYDHPDDEFIRDFMKPKSQQMKATNASAAKKIFKKIISKRRRINRKITMKGYRYL